MAQKGYIKNSVTADLGAPELAAIFKGLLPTNGIINLWDDLACARINDNLVRLSPGVYNLSGYLLGVMQGTTADLAVDSGTAGYNRIDLVVAEFVRNGGGAGVDTLQFKIVKGTSTTGTPADPTLTADDVNIEANTTRQEALYRLTITGTTMAAPELMAASASGLLDISDVSASRTLVIGDNGKTLACSSGSTITITVPPNSAVPFELGATIVLSRDGTGDVTVAAGSGVTIVSSDSKKSINKQYETAALIKKATDTWQLVGSLKT